MNAPNDVRIALVLSGGGVRAIMFHLGVLRAMAERGDLEKVHKISTVSGGSLLAGLIFQEANYCWPTSDMFLSSVYPELRRKLCEKSMQWGALRQLMKPKNWRYLLSRANLLAAALESEWGVRGKLAELPRMPELSINGTTAENGKRFRFKRDTIGDYSIGYAAPGNFPLASALAVSAAFPGAFGPLVLDASRFDWHKRPSWNASADTAVSTNIGYHRLHLYDGGVYDNLGLEPFFDAGRGKAKNDGDVIVVSDAGAPLQSGFSSHSLNPSRLKRVADIMSEQSRALRVRTFAHFLQTHRGHGSYLYIGAQLASSVLEHCEAASFAAGYPTTLVRPSLESFDSIVGHGYRVAMNSDDFALGAIRAPQVFIR